MNIVLVAKCTSRAPADSFDSGDFIIDHLGTISSALLLEAWRHIEIGEDYPPFYVHHNRDIDGIVQYPLIGTPSPGALSVNSVYYPPTFLKEGIWEVNITGEPVAQMPNPPAPSPPDPYYNARMNVGWANIINYGPLDDNVPWNQISEAGDGSDATNLETLTWTIGIVDVAHNPCVCGDNVPSFGTELNSIWSWRIRVMGQWVSDFPP